jgi:L-ascorbate metabolism protein UlaG (beta-lactamase superfamily)
MQLTQIRNATVLLEFGTGSQAVALLVDPMLAEAGALPSLRYLGGTRRRNPLVPLPAEAASTLDRATHALITHCQKGHFDHLDRAGRRFLRERALPVACMPDDAAWLAARGLRTLPLSGLARQPFLGGHITAIPCLHGRGWVGRLMAHGVGYLIEMPDEPSVYVVGDTVLTEPVRHCLSVLQPDVVVLPAGGARFDLGGEILMDADEVAEAVRDYGGQVVVNHLEALDHCPVTRETVRERAAFLGERLWVPRDGESRRYEVPPTLQRAA